ncbi:hypothetical protein [Halodesulfovibrio spirochaetisodalis]|uniref:Uncharacterized protein n=1 Tax=Halodesulfovibrio spirochaetisodalis TaxID=1560234 RepID=A0A1B7XJK8_9BACT|nr:hypothetical protein [Halodesulfovibrio spirochaetisodalis]OBQ55689.1 hypothetical protein SP90_03410 [Halodesulfovibrio spirochaetisodalis]
MSLWMLLCIGLVAGCVDVVPMLRAKVHKYACASAFVFHLYMPVLLWQIHVPVVWWGKGGLVYGICTLPLAILAMRDDKKAPFIMLPSSILIGTVVGLAFWILN